VGRSPAVLHFGDTPTLHYYWKSRYPGAVFVDTATVAPSPALLEGASSVVLVRHVAPGWQTLLRRGVGGAPVLYFLDDDIPGILNDPYLPLRYACKTAWRYAGMARTLATTNAFVLVAANGLAERYGLGLAAVVPPLPVEACSPADGKGTASGELTVFYHATASHRREIRWLREVVQGVAAQMPDVRFEFSGDRRTAGFYADMPNVRVVPPMSWPDFLAYTSSVRYDVGLAPLLDSPFNRCRSYVKFFDITRAGGVGVYSSATVFDEVVRDGANGVLADDSPRSWIAAVCRLCRDGALRRTLFEGAVAEVARLSESGGTA
jgi:glycosyltransferase involved in cell wall biosynthesis